MVAHHHTDNLFRVDLKHGRTDAVTYLEDGYLATVGGIERKIDVMESVEGVAQFFVKFYDDILGHAGYRGNVAHACAYHCSAVILNVRHLDDREIEITEKSVAQLLSGFRKMQVEIVGVMRIDALAQIRVVLIGSTLADGIRTGENAVTVVAGRGSRDDIDFERLAFGMKFFGFGCYGLGYHFRRSGGGKTGKSTFCIVEKKFCGFFRSQDGEFHNFSFF